MGAASRLESAVTRVEIQLGWLEESTRAPLDLQRERACVAAIRACLHEIHNQIGEQR